MTELPSCSPNYALRGKEIWQVGLRSVIQDMKGRKKMGKGQTIQIKKLKALEDTYFIALSMKVDKTQKKGSRKGIKQQLTRTFETPIKQGTVKEISVYSHKKAAEKHGEFPIWDYLVLIQLKNKEVSDEILSDLRKLNFSFQPETIRMELLVTTPNSTYPIPGEKAEKRHVKPFYAVEYVDVRKEYLDDFRQIMITNNGPAMKYIMEHAKWCYNFYALETVSVFYHNPKYPTWNQVHVIGLYLESMIQFKKDFSKGLELANNISFEENFARLKKIRTMLYKSIGGKLV